MRQFKLINAAGAEWNLMQRDGFLHAPSGLGYTRSFSALRAGYDWLVSEDFLKQKTPSGEMVFLSYPTYDAFVSFISRDDPLWLMYKPNGTWYRCRCKVQKLDKGEMSAPNLLVCPIQFVCLGTWHEPIIATQADVSANAGKVYPYAYPYQYADTTLAVAQVKNGDLESPCKLHIFGPVTNPVWSITQGGKSLLSGRMNVSIPEGNKLVVSALPAEMEIAEYTRENEFVRDCYALSDFSTARFIYAPPGESTLSVSGESGGSVSAVLEVEKVAYTV